MNETAKSGTDYAVNRQHQYVDGRLMQPDPIAGSTLYPQSLNRYSYTSGDPANWTDPLGLVRENPWSLWAGFGLLGGTNITWDGGSVSQFMLGMVAHLWMSGAADIIPQGWELNSSGQLVNPSTDTVIDNPNDFWRSLPLGSNSWTLLANFLEALGIASRALGNQTAVGVSLIFLRWTQLHC